MFPPVFLSLIHLVYSSINAPHWEENEKKRTDDEESKMNSVQWKQLSQMVHEYLFRFRLNLFLSSRMQSNAVALTASCFLFLAFYSSCVSLSLSLSFFLSFFLSAGQMQHEKTIWLIGRVSGCRKRSERNKEQITHLHSTNKNNWDALDDCFERGRKSV